MFDWNVCNINGPGLIQFSYYGISQNIWAYLCLLHSLREVQLRVDRINIRYNVVTTQMTQGEMEVAKRIANIMTKEGFL